MKTFIPLLSSLLLLSACGTLQETARVSDDVYDIPDRQAMAAATAEKKQARATEPAGSTDAYYDPAQSQTGNSAYRDYYDMAYNDPYYYNYGRFGFGSGIGSFGPNYGMGLSYGWPTSFGSVSLGYGVGYGSGYGYDPYWSNSWMSGYGYGYNPYNSYGYYPYGYYGYGNYGSGYGGYGQGYGPYQGPWGGCNGCYEPVGYGNTTYGHRSSISSGNTSDPSPDYAPRNMRNPAALMAPRTATPQTLRSPERTTRPERITAPQRERNARPVTPARNWDNTPAAPSRGGNDAGGGRTNSPRPR
ncbi:MAG: hypothetical protein IPN44_08485 [Flavobacteriales bacterium]|nr:hypothetical protein [Flavobacteriales bacterium]